mmetsp:Transcript_29297/g.48425  ORF Transcript_29297/g.48425 Transcript_29297/m.48425 type:complete len:214 (-) Transcript_29297:35-676(-)
MLRLNHDLLQLTAIVISVLWNTSTAFSPIRTIRTLSYRSTLIDSVVALQAGPPAGRIEDIDQWIEWTSDSLQQFDNQTLFDFMNVDTMEDIHNHERYAVLSHGVQDDPIFCYSNVAARTTFQYTEDEFYQLPSRYSAPVGGGERKDRAQIMNDVNNDNLWIIPNGIRIRKDGSLFEFRDVILWNVYHHGVRVGQSAVYDREKVMEVKDDDVVA